MIFQSAPEPTDLIEIVSDWEYKPGWSARYHSDYRRSEDGCRGSTLVITVNGQDAYHPEERRVTGHIFGVPAATYNRKNWLRWFFDRVQDVEHHEMCESFVIKGERPYAPNHGPGHDPYFIREVSTDEERRTNNQGVVKPRD